MQLVDVTLLLRSRDMAEGGNNSTAGKRKPTLQAKEKK